jgi:NhaA family Na+:H+ antiporter
MAKKIYFYRNSYCIYQIYINYYMMLKHEKKPLHYKIMTPLRYFFNDSRAVGVLLILSTVISLVLANAGNSENYINFWHHPFYQNIKLPDSLGAYINDFLMSFFFLLAGMEIKRELLNGELSSFKKAILPFGAALGGMVMPALIFIVVNARSMYIHGWGIPTATDIAFSLGVASLFGKRIPVGLKILLMALAIIDDLGAIVVIALFYGASVNWLYLGLGLLVYLLLWASNIYKMKFGVIQICLSLILWYSIYNSGIEASICGVLIAFALPLGTIPVIEKYIHKPVNFIILPLFALANTALYFPSNFFGALSSTISLGVILGLVIGKPLGIFLFSRLLVFLKIAKLPSSISWSQLLGMGMLAGIGFTMSIFTTNLAFNNNLGKDTAKIAILISMVGSVIISWAYFSLLGVKKEILRAEVKESANPVTEFALN